MRYYTRLLGETLEIIAGRMRGYLGDSCREDPGIPGGMIQKN